jgi:hypothetical protein
MRAILLVLLLACSRQQDELEAARRNADKARVDMNKAEAEAAAAQQKAATAVEEQRSAEASMHEAEQRLADVRRQAADMIVLAKKKLAQLTAQRDAETDAVKRAALTKQIDDLERAIQSSP